MYRFIIFIAALAVMVAACSSGATSPDTTTTSGVDGSETTTPSGAVDSATATTGASAAETTTTVGAVSLESCVIGRWVLDPVAFFEEVMGSGEEIDGEFVFVGGEYVLIIEPDGTFTTQRDDWTFAVTNDSGDLQVTVNETDTGTWTFEGNVLTTTLVAGDPAEIEILIDGEPFVFPGGVAPFEPPQVEFTAVTVTCDNDTLTATFDVNESVWNRA